MANAGTAADHLLKAAGLTWPDVIRIAAPPPEWRTAVVECLNQPDAPLSNWDRNFLSTIYRQLTLSEKQWHQLCRIVAACRLAREAA